MKQFSLEEYLANPNQKITTRDGKASNVRIVCTDLKGRGDFSILALVEESGVEHIITVNKKGEVDAYHTYPLDLFFAPRKVTKWVNVYSCGSSSTVTNYFSVLYGSEEEAKQHIQKDSK